jgi:hypothetical protein
MGRAAADETLLLFPSEEPARHGIRSPDCQPRLDVHPITPTLIPDYPQSTPSAFPTAITPVGKRLHDWAERGAVVVRQRGLATVRLFGRNLTSLAPAQDRRVWLLFAIVGASGVLAGVAIGSASSSRPVVVRTDTPRIVSVPARVLPLAQPLRTIPVSLTGLVPAKPVSGNAQPTGFAAKASPSVSKGFKGRLIVESEPSGATVLINQRPVGVTPLELPRYPASSYAIWVQHEGYERWTAGLLVPANKVTRVNARLQKGH